MSISRRTALQAAAGATALAAWPAAAQTRAETLRYVTGNWGKSPGKDEPPSNLYH